MVVRLSALCAGHTYPQEMFLVLISIINHWVYDQILVEMIQEDRTVPCEINTSITLGIRNASSVKGIRQCTCYRAKKPTVIISCAQTLGTKLPWHLIFGDPP